MIPFASDGDGIVAAGTSFNLLQCCWLPFLRRSGRVEWARPDALTHDLDGDPVVGVSWGRPDFDAAAYEFLIGLLATAIAPADDVEWREFWRRPPPPEVLAARWQSLSEHFDLDGVGARFLQDLDELDGAEEKDIAGLFIDSPGDKTIRDNTDHFVKRGHVPAIGRPAAAMALFTLQAYAPAGGVGHRTSLRGGGPLTTLVEHPQRPALWHRLWLSVETRQSIQDRNAAGQLAADPGHVFPWTVPTRTSNPKARGVATTAADVHALQVYWGMPRRIRLIFEPSSGRPCALTGRPDDVLVRAYRTRNYGTNYTDDFKHPLTPYYCQKVGEPWLAVHGQPGGIGFRHWVGLLVRSEDATREPSAAVTSALRRLDGPDELRLSVLGYDMDNAKPRGFIASAMPIVGLADPDHAELMRLLSQALVLATDQAARLMLGTIKAALFDNPAEARGDLSFYGERLWRVTEADFYGALRSAMALDPTVPDPDLSLRQAWRSTLRTAALALFDEAARIDALDIVDLARVAAARRNLLSGFGGFGKSGRALFAALRLAGPIERTKRRGAAGRGRGEARA
jgi:CRISPR system Cascade subunit CasA